MKRVKITQALTNVDSASFQRYLNEINRIDLLSITEEIQLAKKIRGGDRAALERLVKANLRFVVSVAKKYEGMGMPLSDLVSEGNLGLMRAAESFDETRGFKFITYAVWWVRQAILFGMAEHLRLIRLPFNQKDNITALRRAQDILEQKLERAPSTAELSQYIKISEQAVKEQLRLDQRIASLDKPVEPQGNEEPGANLVDFIPAEQHYRPDENLEREDLSKEIKRILAKLLPKDQYILKGIFGIDQQLPLSLDQMSQELNRRRDCLKHVTLGSISRIKKIQQQQMPQISEYV